MDSTQRQHEGYRSPARWNTAPVPPVVAERAYTKVEKQEDGCWISRYSVASHGYAQVGWQVRPGYSRMVLAHRASWAHVHGQVPIGMTIDHVCKQRRCVNPDHLRLMSNFENARRNNGADFAMGQCGNGHPNTSLVEATKRTRTGEPRMGLQCRECTALYAGRYDWRTRYPGKPLPARLLLWHERETA